MKKIYDHIKGDSLYKNSSYLITGNVVATIFGFIFWAIATRIFSVEEIGLASTLISATDLIASFALLGLNIGLVRYLATSERKNDEINSVFSITILTSVLTSVIFILGLKYFSPSLLIIHNKFLVAVVFVIFVVFLSLAESIKSVFRSFRKSEYVLFKNIVFSILKFILIFFFIKLGTLGIFSSWMVSLAVSCLIGLAILIKKFDYKFKVTIKIDVIKKMFFFSFANYVSEFFERAARTGIPLIITSVATAEKTAYYFIDMSIAMFLFMLPEAIGSSFYAESSADESTLAINTKKVLYAFGLILVPSILGIVFFGNYILLFFGKEYSVEGFMLLRLLSVSTIFIAINSLCSNIVRIKYKMHRLILINFLGAATILGLSNFLINYSITGIGWAWLIGNGIMSIVYLTTTFLYKS